MTEIRAHMRHIREAKLCARGARAWFEKHQIDYRDFLANGVPVALIEPLHDAFGDRVCALARAEWEADHGR